MSSVPPDREEEDLLAAELAFGLLDGDERARAERRLADDAEFAALHVRWASYAALMLVARAEPPRPSLWTGIEKRLPANDIAPPAAASRTLLSRRRVAGLAGLAAAIIGGVVLFHRPAPPPPSTPIPPQSRPAPALVAVLTGEGTRAVVSVSFDQSTGRLLAASAGLDLKNKVPELWVIPADGKPRSLGVIAEGRPIRLRPAPALVPALAPGATFAISVEPLGGSPTGAPTGAVILTGVAKST